MSNITTIFSNIRTFALVAMTGASLLLAGCGGGGGGDDEEQQLQLTALSQPDLDGVVFGDNQDIQSRPDLQPGVGDFALTTGASPARAVSYYSFDVSDIPAGATIKSATLSLFARDTLGNPQGMMVLVRVDHVNYGANFPQTLLGATGLDFNFATINDIGTIGRKEIDATAQLQADIDAGRSTSQFRLRGAIATNADNITDMAFLTDGEDSFGTGEVPMLIIELEE